MELNNTEICSIKETMNEVEQQSITDLKELDLALVGGGIGDFIAG